jgi:LDH2 family malate/lactate/ureidoglycolate dehydrogenase
MLALMVEVLVTALTGARLGFEHILSLSVKGDKPMIGQAF